MKFPLLMIFIVLFAVLSKGAHDLWAATAVYLAVGASISLFLLTVSGRQPKQLKFPLLTSPVIFLAIVVVSFLHSSNPSESFLGMMDWFAAIGFLFLSVQVFTSDESVDLLLKMMVPFFCLLVLVLGKQMFFVPLGDAGLPEVPGTMMNSNLMAAFIIFWIPPLIEKAKTKDIFWIVGLTSCLVALLLVRSVWAWMVVLIELAICFRSRKVKIFMVGAGILLVGIFLLRLFSAGSPSDRLQWWQAALNMFLAHPWFGVGIGNFPSAFLSFKVAMGQNTLFAHSLWLGLLAETGVLGLISFLVFIGAFFSRADNKNPFTRGVYLFLLFASVNLGQEALANLVVLGLFMGISLRGISTKSIGINRVGSWLGTAIFICAIPYLLAPFLASRHVVDGELFLTERDWGNAEKSFHAAISLDGLAWEPSAGLARAAFEQGNYQQAVDHQQKAIALNRLSVPLEKQLEVYQRYLR